MSAKKQLYRTSVEKLLFRTQFIFQKKNYLNQKIVSVYMISQLRIYF